MQKLLFVEKEKACFVSSRIKTLGHSTKSESCKSGLSTPARVNVQYANVYVRTVIERERERGGEKKMGAWGEK